MNEASKLVPANGVYVVKAIIDGAVFNGMMNIGLRPTIASGEDARKRKIEIHLFNFNEPIYDKKLEVHIISRIRDEIKFDNLSALKEQLTKDKIKSIKILNV